MQSGAAATSRQVLSNDGLKLARWEEKAGFVVRDVIHGGQSFFSFGRVLQRVQLHYTLKPGGLHVTVGDQDHFIGWSSGALIAVAKKKVSNFTTRDKPLTLEMMTPKCDVKYVSKDKSHVPFALKTANNRLTSSAESILIAAADAFGHLLLFQRPNRLLCMFYFYMDDVAIWATDGTRFGRGYLLYGAATPGAREKIGELLLEAESGTEGGLE